MSENSCDSESSDEEYEKCRRNTKFEIKIRKTIRSDKYYDDVYLVNEYYDKDVAKAVENMRQADDEYEYVVLICGFPKTKKV